MGDVIDRDDIIRILDFGVPVLVDEAYIEFSDEKSIIDLINYYDNLYVTRTFSKAYGSAGIRLGIIASQSKNIEKMIQFRPMYEINNLTAKWGLLVIDNFFEVYNYIDYVKMVREKVTEICRQGGYEVIDGNCNWIHVRGLKNLPKHIIFKENCEVPNMGNNWIRLQITDNIKDYEWITRNRI
jgi:histidinol-phosphate aminotransferase